MKNNKFISIIFAYILLMVLSFQIIEQFHDTLIEEDQIELSAAEDESDLEDFEIEKIISLGYSIALSSNRDQQEIVVIEKYIGTDLKSSSPPPEF